MTARTHRQAVAAVASSTRPINRCCAATITLSIGFAVWQLAFRPPLDRPELIIELAVGDGAAGYALFLTHLA